MASGEREARQLGKRCIFIYYYYCYYYFFIIIIIIIICLFVHFLRGGQGLRVFGCVKLKVVFTVLNVFVAVIVSGALFLF